MGRKEVAPCPACGNKRIWYVRSLTRRFKKYYMECSNCHYCGKAGMTERSAAQMEQWNNERG